MSYIQPMARAVIDQKLNSRLCVFWVSRLYRFTHNLIQDLAVHAGLCHVARVFKIQQKVSRSPSSISVASIICGVFEPLYYGRPIYLQIVVTRVWKTKLSLYSGNGVSKLQYDQLPCVSYKH